MRARCFRRRTGGYLPRTRMGWRAGAALALSVGMIVVTAASGRAHEEDGGGAPEIDFVPGEGLSIESADGRYSLTLGLRGMLLLTTEIPDAGPVGLSLEMRRARLLFEGAMFDRDLRYRLQLAFAPEDLEWEGGLDGRATRTPLLDWYVESRHLRDLHVRVGQFVVTYSRERTISSRAMQLVDRSIASDELSLDRDLGVEVWSSDLFGLDVLRYYAGITIGEGRDGLGSADTGLLYYVRVELLPAGMFDDYVQGDLARSSEPRVSIGAAYSFLDDGPLDRGLEGEVPADAGTTDFHGFAADAVLMWHGFSAHVEVLWRRGTRTPGDAVDDEGLAIPVAPPRNGYGAFVAAGYLLPGLPVELAARWSMIAPLGAGSALEERHELGGGVNVYLDGHALKLQADVFTIWRAEDGIERGDERVRVQLQASL